MALIEVGTRVRRAGFPPDPYHGMRGSVVGHDLNERTARNPRPLRYNLVTFDLCPNQPGVAWVEGHAGIVPLDAIEQLADLAGRTSAGGLHEADGRTPQHDGLAQ